jgi:hypothetical protein
MKRHLDKAPVSDTESWELGGAWHIVPVSRQIEIEAWFRRGGCAGRLSSQTAKKDLWMAALAKLPRPKRPAEFQYLRAKTSARNINFRHKTIKFAAPKIVHRVIPSTYYEIITNQCDC